MKDKFREKKLKDSKISVKPFVYSIPSISSVSIKILLLLGLQVIMLLLTKSFNAFFVVIVESEPTVMEA